MAALGLGPQICNAAATDDEAPGDTVDVNGLYYALQGDSVGVVGYDFTSPSVSGDLVIEPQVEINGHKYDVVYIISNFYRNNTKITSLKCPPTLKRIGSGAFSGCTNMKSVDLSTGVMYIDKNAFNGCTALTSVSFPASLQTFGTGCFEQCSSLTSIQFETSDNMLIIPQNCFAGCSSLKYLRVPANVITIQDGAFEKTGLETILFVDSDMPLTIQNSAFVNDNPIQNIYVYRSKVIKLQPNGFSDNTYQNGTLYIYNKMPADVQNHYMTDTGWKYSRRNITTGIEGISADDSADGVTEYFTLTGQRVSNPRPGIYLMRQGNKVCKTLVR